MLALCSPSRGGNRTHAWGVKGSARCKHVLGQLRNTKLGPTALLDGWPGSIRAPHDAKQTFGRQAYKQHAHSGQTVIRAEHFVHEVSKCTPTVQPTRGVSMGGAETHRFRMLEAWHGTCVRRSPVQWAEFGFVWHAL